jgi:hypothetical protein
LVLNILQSVQNDEQAYKYICDIVNHSKHKYTMSPEVKFINENGKLKGKVYFNEFTQKKKTYEETESKEIVLEGYNKVFNLMCELGDELFKIVDKTYSNT